MCGVCVSPSDFYTRRRRRARGNPGRGRAGSAFWENRHVTPADPAPPSDPLSTRVRVGAVAAAVVLLAAGTVGAAVHLVPRSHPARLVAVPAPTTTAAPVTTTTTTVAARPAAPPFTDVPAVTTVADITADTPGSAVPGGPAVKVVPSNWYGYPSLLPVIATAPGWLEVREAQRPNQSTAWIPARAATLSQDGWYLGLDLANEHLYVFRSGQLVASYPAGIGTPGDPTVTGHYFVAMIAPAPDPSYGPFVLGTSAHSDAISDWELSGDAIIGIHGPITSYDDQLIGTTGAAISHGCVRLHDGDLGQLRDVPPGTPLDIVG